MIKSKYISLTGLIFLLIAGITPLASINSIPVTILPFFGNEVIGGQLWLWRNISAFFLTHHLALIAGLILVIRNNHTGIIITGIIFFINSLFIFIALVMTKTDADIYNDINYNFEWGWIFIVTGIILLFIGGSKIVK